MLPNADGTSNANCAVLFPFPATDAGLTCCPVSDVDRAVSSRWVRMIPGLEMAPVSGLICMDHGLMRRIRDHPESERFEIRATLPDRHIRKRAVWGFGLGFLSSAQDLRAGMAGRADIARREAVQPV
jgi:hypothetical protein